MRVARFAAGLLHGSPHALDLVEQLLLTLPHDPLGRQLLLQPGDLRLDLVQPVQRRRRLLAPQPLTGDLELPQRPLDPVDLLRERVDLDAHVARRLVDQVDGLVREEALRDVAVRQPRRGHDGIVRDADTVVRLVALAYAAQDLDGLLDARLVDVDGLEAPGERLVLLDVLPVLVQRRCTHAAELAAGELGLEHVGRVHRALACTRAHEGVQLVDEQDDLALGGLDLVEDRLQALLELAAELGAGDQRAQVQPEQAALLERLGRVPGGHALRQPLHDGRLARAGRADQDGVVLGAPREHLHEAPDLLVPPDDGVELAAPRQLREVARVAFERLVLALGVRVGDALVAAHLLQRLEDHIVRCAEAGERLGQSVALLRRHRQQHVLGGDVLVLQRLPLPICLLQHVLEPPRDADIRAPRDAWRPRHDALDAAPQG